MIGSVGVGAGVGVGVGVGVGSELEDDEELVVGEGLGVGERQRKVSNEQEMSHDKVPPPVAESGARIIVEVRSFTVLGRSFDNEVATDIGFCGRCNISPGCGAGRER